MYQYPNYFQQPYTPTLPAQPIQQPMQVQSGIMGHMVASHEEIKPNDVPMNGAAAYFPSQDGSVIYAKQWNPNGSITTVRYIPETVQQEDEQTPTLADVINQLNNIEDLLRPKRPATKKPVKKEVEDDSE